MTGIAGGAVDRSNLDAMVEALHHEEWYASEEFWGGSYGLGMQHHGKKDPKGYTFWTDGQRAGAIDGAVSNLDELGWGTSTVFENLRAAPEHTLDSLEGPFTIAYVDPSEDRILLATDKIGSRPPAYTTENGFAFGSGLGPLLPVLDDPVIDAQGVSDLLLMGHMWSDTTLLEEVRMLHPATLLEYCDGEYTKRRYWHPEYEPVAPTDAYFHRLTNGFQLSVDRIAKSVTDDVGLWLSGGLDSRATLSELDRNLRNGAELDSLVAYTYDANPGGEINPKLAREVARTLELPIETVPLTPDRFLPVMDKAIDVTDGMVKLNTLVNLSAVFNIREYEPDILMEGIVGELVGQHLSRYHITEASSLVDSMYHSEATLSTDQVRNLLDVDVDPLGSFRKEAQRTDESSFEKAVVDVHYRNYYPRMVHASNPVPRSQTGTRIPYADGDFLSLAARLPVSWRMGTFPFSDGELIYGVVKPKIRMMRALDADLAEIPYERSRLKPVHPYLLHVVGFFGATALSQLRSQPTYGGKSMVGEWYRSHDGFRERIDDLIDGACKRRFFNVDTVREYRRRHLQGESDEMNVLGPIATFELWMRRNVD